MTDWSQYQTMSASLPETPISLPLVPIKTLCVCQYGHNRSQGLAWLLNWKYHHPAIATGWVTHDGAIPILGRWADRILVVEGYMVAEVNKVLDATDRSKVRVYEIGGDRWVNPRHPEMLALLGQYIDKDYQKLE